MEDNILDYIKSIEKLDDSRDITSVLSTLDHKLTKMIKEERLDFLDKISEQNICNVDKETQVFIAGLLEYVYNENNKSTENKWFMNSKYKLDTVLENSILNSIPENIREKTAIKMLDTALQEFKWRNMIYDEMFNSF